MCLCLTPSTPTLFTFRYNLLLSSSQLFIIHFCVLFHYLFIHSDCFQLEKVVFYVLLFYFSLGFWFNLDWYVCWSILSKTFGDLWRVQACLGSSKVKILLFVMLGKGYGGIKTWLGNRKVCALVRWEILFRVYWNDCLLFIQHKKQGLWSVVCLM